MLELKTLFNKGSFTKPNGDVVVDLIRRAVSFIGIRANSGKAYIVSEETAMRADLISNYFYQNSSYADLLLKYNGYSNPFSLDVGDVIRIPSAENLLKYGGNGKPKEIELVASRKKPANLVLAPKTRKDLKRLEYLLKKGNSTDANLAKLSVLLENGNVANVGGQLAAILQGGNFAGLGPLTSSYQADASVPVPPNVALENGVKLANGKIVFGNDVTNVKKEDCPEPISRAKLKETLIKNKLA